MSKSRKIKIGIAAGIIVILAVAMIVMKGGKKAKGGMLGQALLSSYKTIYIDPEPATIQNLLSTHLTKRRH